MWLNALLGDAELHLGEYEGARALVQMALNHSRESGDPELARWSLYGLGLVAVAREAYDEAEQLFRESADKTRKAGHQGLLGRALAGLGLAARGLGDVTRAQGHLFEALRTAAEIRQVWTVVDALPTVALILSDQGEVERAVELYALAARYPYVANSRWFEDVAGKRIAAVAATLPLEVVAAAQERGKAHDLWATAEELLAELEHN